MFSREKLNQSGRVEGDSEREPIVSVFAYLSMCLPNEDTFSRRRGRIKLSLLPQIDIAGIGGKVSHKRKNKMQIQVSLSQVKSKIFTGLTGRNSSR